MNKETKTKTTTERVHCGTKCAVTRSVQVRYKIERMQSTINGGKLNQLLHNKNVPGQQNKHIKHIHINNEQKQTQTMKKQNK